MEEENKMEVLKIQGVPASLGIGIGKAVWLRRENFVQSEQFLASETERRFEVDKFRNSLKEALKELEGELEHPKRKLNEEERAILDTQIEFLLDPQLEEEVLTEIEKQGKTAMDAVIECVQKYVNVFRQMDDAYMNERASDIQDVGSRILNHVASQKRDVLHLDAEAIVLADEIYPSDALAMDLQNVKGFATQVGGLTSHTAILAKSKGIPAVLGCSHELMQVKEGQCLILDGEQGLIYVNPNEELLRVFRAKLEEAEEIAKRLAATSAKSAQMKDGTRINVLVNASNLDDLQRGMKYAADGVGLFRTELAFSGKEGLPSEEEQFQLYKALAQEAKGLPITIRTFDIGGDKPLGISDLEKEENPFLGFRGIRIGLARPELLETQLRAILRASAFGKFKIMFPMISQVEELRKAKMLFGQVKSALTLAQMPFDEHIALGIMIEVPAAAISSDVFAKEVDFFSIGTNDLCQYTMAVDRGNEQVRALYDPYNPSVLRLIRYTIEQANLAGIKTSLCGELASELLAVPLLLGLGLRQFSANATSIPALKAAIGRFSAEEAQIIGQKVLDMDSSELIKEFLQSLK
ncbi:phosphoenolpyruvate--protein phosphotransferase [Marinilongibacter aquaticus]|uniref:phosphoenolpyruvate--protein phosphotransferase n=1 Tax=Marinilongibacter aquaticus TaxID=2975157 RepID=UPI0021BDA2AF|nr:phosphoenolpyruvate--protein phosphotransferase [Marinilongibacter aquaticus]UBM58010.1 phosphoenolpyruvate--protein phosphotransferase [Marinilongibacter aquaticus]